MTVRELIQRLEILHGQEYGDVPVHVYEEFDSSGPVAHVYVIVDEQQKPKEIWLLPE